MIGSLNCCGMRGLFIDCKYLPCFIAGACSIAGGGLIVATIFVGAPWLVFWSVWRRGFKIGGKPPKHRGNPCRPGVATPHSSAAPVFCFGRAQNAP